MRSMDVVHAMADIINTIPYILYGTPRLGLLHCIIGGFLALCHFWPGMAYFVIVG